MATSVTPVAGVNTVITTGGVAVEVAPANINGGYIVNPYSNTDQGITTAEVLYVSAVSDPTLQGNGVTIALQPGQSYQMIPGQTTMTKANANSNGHKFTAVYW